MRLTVLFRAAVLFLLASTAAAQQLHFGERIPLTNTRYGTIEANGILTANDRDPYLAWVTPENVRVTRLDGERRVGRPVLTVPNATDVDMVWTGTHFFIAASYGTFSHGVNAPRIVGRLLDRTGEPAGDQFEIVAGGEGPSLASNGSHILLAYRTFFEIRTQRLSRLGAITGDPSTIETRGSTAAGDIAYAIASNGTNFAAMTVSDARIISTTFDATGVVVFQRSLFTSLQDPLTPRYAALAGSGQDYLGVWIDGMQLEAVTIAAGGAIGAPFEVLRTNVPLHHPSLTFGNGRFHTAVASGGTTPRPLFAEIDAAARTATPLSQHEVTTHPETWTTILSFGDTLLAGWRDDESGAVRVLDLHDAASSGVEATVGAAEQTLAAAAASANGTLVIWSEELDGREAWYAGIWNQDGWGERRIPITSMKPVRAASDGSSFIVVIQDAEAWAVLHLDTTLDIRSVSAPVTGREVFDIAWNGDTYGVAYLAGTAGAVARVSRTGAVLPGVIVKQPGDEEGIVDMSITSDGTNFLVAWQRVRSEICFPVCDPDVEFLEAALLTPTLQRIGDILPIAGDDSFSPVVAWNGDDYLVVWATRTDLRTTWITEEGDISRIIRNLAALPATLAGTADLDLVGLGTTSALYWERQNGPSSLLTRSSSTLFPAPTGAPRLLVATGNDHAAVIGTEASHEAPHHGAQRLILRHAAPVAFAPVPDPPIASVERVGNRLHITWTGPDQPVTGYRLEYRVGDGSWNELGVWFEEDEREYRWSNIRVGMTYSFRLRAYTDAGPSLYSVPVQAYIGKRRAAR